MNRSLPILLGLLNRLAAEEDHDHLLSTGLSGVLEMTGAERGFLMQRTAAGRMLVVAAKNIGQERIFAADFRPYRKVVEGVVNDGESFVSSDARGDLGLIAPDGLGAARPHAVMVAPWRVGAKVRGALYIDQHYDVVPPFDSETTRLVQTLADVIARLAHLDQRQADLAAEARALREARDLLELNNTSLQEDVAAKSVELANAERALVTSHRALAGQYTFENIVGRGPAMQAVFGMIDQVVDYPVPVLITGESGTGKELVARSLHFRGARAALPFMVINCAAIPENLLESELFGYRKGAFTGAGADKEGLFRAAGRGTVFLDEIGEMPLTTQVKLLRVLQEREVRPVGSAEAEPVHARILAATNRNLINEVRAGRFREDLYYRLNVVHVDVPSLARRVEDIPALVNHFLDRLAKEFELPRKRMSPEAMQRLLRSAWPGNVRQLENAIKSTVVLSQGLVIAPGDLRLPDPRDALTAPGPHPAEPQHAPTSPEASRPIHSRSDWEAVERTRILDAMVACGWNKSRAAERLGVSRRNLYRKLARYGIEGAD